MRTGKKRTPDVHFYEWSVFRWVTSRAHDELDATGRGIYREMLDTCYAQGSVSSDPEILCRKCVCGREELEVRWAKIRCHFYQDKHDSSRLKNKLADAYRKNYFVFLQKQRANATKPQKSVPKKSSESKELCNGGPAKPIAVAEPSLRTRDDTTRDDTRRDDTRREDTLPTLSLPRGGALADEDGFPDFRSEGERLGISGSEPDWGEARLEWRRLDFKQRLTAVRGLRDREGTDDPALKSLPVNYLRKRMWERKIAGGPPPQPKPALHLYVPPEPPEEEAR